jgi:hypothetical protein
MITILLGAFPVPSSAIPAAALNTIPAYDWQL